jgi:hypothetical protein
VPQLFRYERQQRRLREHFQFNADIIGDQPGGDASSLLFDRFPSPFDSKRRIFLFVSAAETPGTIPTPRRSVGKRIWFYRSSINLNEEPAATNGNWKH